MRISERDILSHAGKISHNQAADKARTEYEKYKKQQLKAPSSVEKHFLEAVKELKLFEKSRTHRKIKREEESD